MKNLFKKLVLVASLLMTTLSFSQTLDNIKVETSKCDGIKIHLVNDGNFNVFNQNTTLEVSTGKIGPLTSEKVFTTETHYQKSEVGDTVVTYDLIIPLYMKDTLFVFIYNGNTYKGAEYIGFNFLSKISHKLDSYKPCYVTVGPDTEKPTIFFEAVTNNISHYDIKRNGQLVASVPNGTGILSYTDVNNTQSLNFVQNYTVVSVDSCGNEVSGDVSTIHARNLSSVDGNVEMDWTVPQTSKPITNYNIYELNGSDLVLIETVPSTVTQYTVISPNVNSSYVVGIESMNCTGTSKLKSLTGTLLSNKVKTNSTASLTDVSLSSDDEVTGYFDTLGRPVDPTNTKGLVIITHKSGKSTKVVF